MLLADSAIHITEKLLPRPHFEWKRGSLRVKDPQSCFYIFETQMSMIYKMQNTIRLKRISLWVMALILFGIR